MSQLCDKRKIRFTYNRVNNKNPKSGFDVAKFCQRRKVAVEFTTHAINFKTVSKSDLIFNYNFRLQSLYLIQGEKTIISTSSRRKKELDE